MFRLLLISLVLLGLFGALIAWSAGGSESPADFTFVNRGDHKTLDPGLMSWLQDIRVAYAFWEGLYTLDDETLQPIPGVSEKLDIDPTKKIYTFHLRPNARWTNGDPVTSADFVFSWRRILEQPGDYTFLHYYIQGAKEYEEAYASWQDKADQGPAITTIPPPDYGMVGVKAIDPHTLQVTLRNPTPFFLSLCAFPPFFPLHEPSMRSFARLDEKTGRVASYDQGFTRPPYLVSNGPYRLAEWTFKRNLRMIASDYYWNKSAVHLRIIDEPVIEDSLAAVRAYMSGRVDWVSWVDEDLIGQMRTAGGYPDLHLFESFGTYFYVLNCLPTLPDGRKNPLADARVRQALAMSIDKQAVVGTATRAGQHVAADFMPTGVFSDYPSPKGLPFDIAKARALLADAGYPNGKGFPPMQILFNKEMQQHVDIALMMRSQWKENLGIDTDIQQVEIKVFGARLHARDYAIARASWTGDYPDPTTFTDKFRSDNDDNNAGWANPQYDALCDAAETKTDPAERMRTLAQAEGLLLDQAAIIPLYRYVDAYLFRPQIQGIHLDTRDMVMFQAIYKTGVNSSASSHARASTPFTPILALPLSTWGGDKRVNSFATGSVLPTR